jgi:uncharacterized protein (TIGR00369 family)
MDQMRTLVEGFIVGSPYGRKLGMVCEEVAEDRVSVRLPFAPDVVTLGDLVHGGAIASLIDVAATGAGWASPRVELGGRGTTVGFAISYLAAGRGQDLLATARVIQRGGSISIVDVDVHGADGTYVARATVTYKIAMARGASLAKAS